MKTSVTKKTLSVFLSVLMMLSCCVTAMPWLSETFGLKANAEASVSEWQAVTTAVDYAISTAGTSGMSYTTSGANSTSRSITDTSARGVMYPIIRALMICISKEYGGNRASTSINHPSTLLSTINGKIDNYVSDSSARTIVKNLASFIITYSSFNYYYSPQADNNSNASSYGAHYDDHGWYTDPDDISDLAGYSITVSRNIKAAIWYYNDINSVNTTEATSFTMSFSFGKDAHRWTHGGISGKTNHSRNMWYYYSGVSVGDNTNSSTNISYVINFLNYFKTSVSYVSDDGNNTTINCERVQADPFCQFADLNAANTAVTNNTTAYNAIFNSGYWSASDTTDISIINHFGGQYTTVAGESHNEAFTNAVDRYIDACEDALSYYTAKPYAKTIYDILYNNSYTSLDGITENGLNLSRLTFYRDPADNTIKDKPSTAWTEDAFDTEYMDKTTAILRYNAIKAASDFIENQFSDKTSKGYLKLGTVDHYYKETDTVVNGVITAPSVQRLLIILEDFYEYYNLVFYKDRYDAEIVDYEIPTVDQIDLSQGTYKFRDTELVSDQQIEILYGDIAGFYTSLTNSTYSNEVLFYAFGNANFDSTPDYQYVETVRDYLSYEVSRRGFICELAPFIAHFSAYLGMNLGSLTANQLQGRIKEDQAIYEKVYAYTFTDGQGNQLVDLQGNAVTTTSLGYGPSPSTYGEYCYKNVYAKYYDAANLNNTWFNEHPLARADMLELLGDFNEDVQAYIENLYIQLAELMKNRIVDAMNATNDADGNLTITLSNFSSVKSMLERVTKFFTVLADPTYDENEVQNGVYVFNYLKNNAYMYKQTQTFVLDGKTYKHGAFSNQKLNLININITTELGNTYTLQDAFDALLGCGLIAKVENFVSSGGLKNWQQLHYYNVGDGDAASGYKFTKPEAYMVRLPYADDLGRGNNSNVAYDTYTVTNKKVEDLVTQLDTFLGSEDMVAILSSLIKLGDEETTMLTNMKLYEYVMKLLGEMLFTDKIINTLANLIYPMITKMLEELWNGLDGNVVASPLNIDITLYTYSKGKTIYQLADALGLAVYPDTLAASSLMQNSQLAAARAALSSNSIKNSDGKLRNVDWVNLLAQNHAEDDETVLNLNWGVDAVEKGENESYTAWFQRRANAFKTALSGVLGGLDALLPTVFSGINYNQPHEITDVAQLVVKASLKNLKIEGINGYSRIIVPLLETLGCSENDIISSNQVSSTLTNTSAIVNAILNPIVNLVVNDVATAPISTILTLLPNLLYFLSFNTLDQLVKDLKIYITDGLLYVDSWIVSWITPSIAWILDLGVVESNLPDGISSDGDTVTIELFKLLGKNSINELITAVDISDINSIIALVLNSVLGENGDLELPIVDVGSVLARAKLYESVKVTNVNDPAYIQNSIQAPANSKFDTKAITSSGAKYNRRTFDADKADMFYDIIAWVAKAFQNDSFINQLVAIITGSNDSPDTLITEILQGVKFAGPARVVMALVEVFQPMARQGVDSNSVWYNTTYMPAEYTWYGRDSAQNSMANKPISKFLYVAYQNDWTYVKANTFVENADTIITKLLENQLREREVNSFGEWLLSLIGQAWSNEAITAVVRLLVTLGNATKNELISYIIGRFTEQGMDLSQWYDAYGYLFPEIWETDEEEGEEEPAEPAEPDYLEPGDTGYYNIFPALSVRLNPEYEENSGAITGTDLNANEKWLWSYNGTELEDGNRQVFQDIISYLLSGGDTSDSNYKGGMMPAIDIFLSGDLGVLFPQLNNTSLLKIYGSNGYDSAIVPFFESLGMNEILDASDFAGFATSVGLTASTDFDIGTHMLRQSEFNKISSEQLKVEYLFNVAFGFLEKLMDADYDMVDGEKVYRLDENGNKIYNNLVGEILTKVVPSLLYFLQSNGLSIFVRNLLQPVLTLVDDLLPAIGLNFDPDHTLDGFVNELLGRFLIEGVLHMERDPDDDYGVSLKDLSLHALAGVIENVTGINMEPLVYGLDAICSVYSADPVDSASEMSTSKHWTSASGQSFKKYAFLTGSYIRYDENDQPVIYEENDPANVVTILLSMLLDLVLADSKVSDGEGGFKTNAEVVIDLLGGFVGDDNAIVNMIPTVIGAIRELGFTSAYTMTPNWSYFDEFDRPGEHRNTDQLIDEANAMFDATGYYLVNTPIRTIYYLRYAENFAPTTNLWSEQLATYLDTSLSDLVDWIIGDFVAGDDENVNTLGDFVQNLLTGENGFINKGVINTINEALYDSIGGAVAQFSELLNIFIGFDVNIWANNPYPEEEEDEALSLPDFGAALAELFMPMNEILTWLLSGKDMALFHSYRTTGGYTEWVMDEADRADDYGDIRDLIVLPGGQGYWVALVPLLEMLGIELPKDSKTENGYLFQRDDAGRIYYYEYENEEDTVGVKTYASGVKILSEVIVTVLSQVNGWLEGVDPLGLGDNLIDIVLNRLANVIYFLNANGLVTVVINLLSPLVPLANAIVPLIFNDLGIPEQGEDEDDSAYATRKFVVLVDELLDDLLYTVVVDDHGDPILMQVDGEGHFVLDAHGDPIPDPVNGKEYHKPILPDSFSILDLNLHNILEVIADITGLDVNEAVTADFRDENNNVIESYNYLENFFLGDISMRTSANGEKYFRMDFNDEESRADFITIIIYTLMDVLNSSMTPGTSNNKFFVNILGKTTDGNGDEIVDEELGQQKLRDLYNILHARVSGYEGYDWFYFDKLAREAYYARTPENEYGATLRLKLQAILEAIQDGGYQVDMTDTTMEYLLTGYLNYTDTNLWDEGTARQVEANFYNILDLALSSFLGDGADLGSYLSDLLEGMQLYSNKYIVMIGALLGDLLKGIPENVADLITNAIPGLDLTYWDQYAGKAVADDEHPAGTQSTDPETGKVTTYIPLVTYANKADFAAAFTSLFTPLGYLLDWLLVGENKGLELFYVVDGNNNDTPAISIGGANGFKEGLVPLLEALGLEFDPAEVNDPDLTGVECIEITLNSLLNWVDGLLSSDNLVGAVIDLVPNIIYFINSNGLTVTVLNTLRSLTNILELASGLINTGDNDITNLNTLLGLDDKGIDIYDLSLEGICNIVKGMTGLDINNAVALAGEASYMQQWAIGKVVTYDSAVTDVEDGRVFYKMQFSYTRDELAAMDPDWTGISLEERAHRMERINIFTILICSVLDIFKYGENEDTLRGWLGEYYDLIMDILNLTASEIHYDPYDWFYFSDEIEGNSMDETSGNWATYFPTDGSEYLVRYLDSTPYTLVYKYGYFEYYKHEAGETGNLWNKDSVGYLKDNFYNLIDTVIGLATDYDSAAAFISDAWNGLNLYSKKNLYSVGYTIGNLLANFEGVLALALNIVLGVDISGQWDEYLLHRVTDDASLVGTQVKDDENNPVTYKNQPVTYIADGSMNRTAFINALVDIFSPADFLISWFLVGADTPLEFLYTKTGEAAIKLNGGNGYDEALVPVLEALGCDLSDSAAYFSANGGKTGINVVKYMADKLLGRIDGIAASANPVQEIVAMLPELIYFINANGLSVSVRNFLQPVISLLSLVNNFVDTGDIGEIEDINDLFAFAMNMLSESVDVNFNLTDLSIADLTITGVFNIVKVITGIDVNTAMTWPMMTQDGSGNPIVYLDENDQPVYKNIYEQLALGKVTRYHSGNGRTAFRMDATDDPAALSQIDMIAILMATVVNVFELKNESDEYANRQAFVDLLGDTGANVFDAVIKILNLEEGKYVDYDWLFTQRNVSDHKPYIDPQYQNTYVSPIDKVSAITGTAGYDKYWTKEMAQYVADNLIPVVNNVLLLIGISIPGIDGPIESIDDLINGLLPQGSLYTNEILAKLTGLIAGTGEVDENGVEDIGLKAKLDEIDPNHAIEGLLKNVLGIDLGLVWAYKGRTDFGFVDGDRDGFVAALAQFLRPVNPLLEWLLTDKAISLFYNADASDLIKIPGGNGYEQAIIPLFEAVIGYDNANIKTLAQYIDDIEQNPDNMLIDILNPLLDFVDAALADPLNVVLGRIPAIVYFINSKAADRMVKNLLSPVYQVLNALNTLVDIDIDSLIKGAIGFSLEELDFNAIIEVVIGLLPDNLSNLSPLIVDAVKEFTIGKVIKYSSHATFYTDKGVPYQYGFTMVLNEESSSGGSGGITYGSTNATLADLITILLRAVLKWVTMPENQETVVNFLNENIEDEKVREYVLNAYGVDADTLGAIDSGLIGFRYTPYGVSKMMALVYYLFFAVNFASDYAVDAVRQYGDKWQVVSVLLSKASTLDTSAVTNAIPGLAAISETVDLSVLSSITSYLDGLVARVNGTSGSGTGTGDNGNNNNNQPVTEDNDTPSPGVNMNFFQKILEWIKSLFAKIMALFH